MQEYIFNAQRSHALAAVSRSLLLALAIAFAFGALMLGVRQMSDGRVELSTSGASDVIQLPVPPLVRGRPY